METPVWNGCPKLGHLLTAPLEIKDNVGIVFSSGISSNTNLKINTHNTVRIKSPCGKCDFVAKSRQQLTKHLKAAHTMLNVFKCDRCDFVTKNSQWFQNHAKRHPGMDNVTHNEATGKFCCKLCSAQFDVEKSFFCHFAKIHKKSKMSHDLHVCPYCDKSYVNNRCLQLHITKTHVNKIPKKSREIGCNRCKRLFWSKSQLETHNMIRHYQFVKRLVCDQCGITFTTKSNMKFHQQKFHPEIFKSNNPASQKPMRAKRCKHCGLTWLNLTTLREHLKEAHPELFKFSCTLCTATYVFKDGLKNHMKSCHREGKVSYN